jgi:hypothetical protein
MAPNLCRFGLKVVEGSIETLATRDALLGKTIVFVYLVKIFPFQDFFVPSTAGFPDWTQNTNATPLHWPTVA